MERIINSFENIKKCLYPILSLENEDTYIVFTSQKTNRLYSLGITPKSHCALMIWELRLTVLYFAFKFQR